jgi:hypothetical protein
VFADIEFDDSRLRCFGPKKKRSASPYIRKTFLNQIRVPDTIYPIAIKNEEMMRLDRQSAARLASENLPMAIGAAKFLGYDFYPNFNMPYISQNLTEFWKRWHISLSSWL